MKRIAFSLLLVSAAAFGHAQDSNASAAGTWKVHASIAGNDSDAECTFTQTGNDLAGTCASQMGSIKITGKVDGKKVSWSYNTEYNGSPLTVKYDGTLDAGKISGGVTVDPFGVTGDFTATPSTEAASSATPPANTPATAPPSPASDNASEIAGKWKIHQSIAGNESDSDCTFTQKDNDLAGECVAPQGSIKIAGKIDGKKVSWSYNGDYNGTALTVKYSGTLDSGKITGEIEVDPFSATGDFTATLAQ